MEEKVLPLQWEKLYDATTFEWGIELLSFTITTPTLISRVSCEGAVSFPVGAATLLKIG